jgi:hypothetical protein
MRGSPGEKGNPFLCVFRSCGTFVKYKQIGFFKCLVEHLTITFCIENIKRFKIALRHICQETQDSEENRSLQQTDSRNEENPYLCGGSPLN